MSLLPNTFEKNWSELELFQEQHGHCCLPSDHELSLSAWLKSLLPEDLNPTQRLFLASNGFDFDFETKDSSKMKEEKHGGGNYSENNSEIVFTDDNHDNSEELNFSQLLDVLATNGHGSFPKNFTNKELLEWSQDLAKIPSQELSPFEFMALVQCGCYINENDSGKEKAELVVQNETTEDPSAKQRLSNNTTANLLVVDDAPYPKQYVQELEHERDALRYELHETKHEAQTASATIHQLRRRASTQISHIKMQQEYIQEQTLSEKSLRYLLEVTRNEQSTAKAAAGSRRVERQQSALVMRNQTLQEYQQQMHLEQNSLRYQLQEQRGEAVAAKNATEATKQRQAAIVRQLQSTNTNLQAKIKETELEYKDLRCQLQTKESEITKTHKYLEASQRFKLAAIAALKEEKKISTKYCLQHQASYKSETAAITALEAEKKQSATYKQKYEASKRSEAAAVAILETEQKRSADYHQKFMSLNWNYLQLQQVCGNLGKDLQQAKAKEQTLITQLTAKQGCTSCKARYSIISNFRKEIDRLRSEATAKKQVMEEHVAELELEKSCLRYELQETRQERQLETQSKKTQVDALRRVIKKTKAEQDSINSELLSLIDQANTATQQHEELLKAYKRLEEQLNNIIKDEQSKSTNTKATELQQVQIENRDLQQRLDTAKKTIRDSAGFILQLQSDLDAAIHTKEQLEAADAAAGNAEEKTAKQNPEPLALSLQQRLQQADEAKTRQTKRIRDLEETNAALDKRLASATKAKVCLKQAFQRSEERRKLAEGECQSQVRVVRYLKEELDHLRQHSVEHDSNHGKGSSRKRLSCSSSRTSSNTAVTTRIKKARTSY